MDKIKQALDRARQQRQGSNENPADNGTVADSAVPIKYNKTKTVSVKNSVLENNRIIHTSDPTAYTDSIKLLRTQVVQRMSENKWNSLAITSTGSGEGKTLTAINLSLSIAMEVGYTVLLIDANLRCPTMHEFFGIKPTIGLSDYLTDNVSLSDALIHPEGFEHFVILPAGKSLRNSSEMLSSPRMGALVNELKERYPKRMIIFDLPPLLDTADALAFMPYVDATLLVVEDGKTKTDDLKNAVDKLSGTNILGTVLNKVPL